MPGTIDPQEIYLLQRYVSLEYFGELRDIWAAIVEHVELCLDSFMRNLPAGYRSRTISEQPDIVWGEHVLPNFRKTLQGLHTGFVLLSHGDARGLDYACGPLNAFKGQSEFWSGWMSEADQSHYADLLHNAVMFSFNISTTVEAGWDPTDLSTAYDADERGRLNRPAQWPIYQVNQNVHVGSGEKVLTSGIYVPQIDDSCAEFLSTSFDEAPLANVLVEVLDRGVVDSEVEIERLPCVWHLVERIADIDRAAPSLVETKVKRTPGGEHCPETGFYFTPARANSRRYFDKGELMPNVETSYGATIWQWDERQTET
jgi:hypothetical protein